MNLQTTQGEMDRSGERNVSDSGRERGRLGET